MAEKLDPQVQIHIITLASEWTKLINLPISTAKDMIGEKAKRFDQAYKAILKTVEQK